MVPHWVFLVHKWGVDNLALDKYSPFENTHKTLLGFCYARAVALRNVFKR